MEAGYTQEDLALRDEIRDFLANEFPADLRDKQLRGAPLSREDIVNWHKLLCTRGWTGIHWPVEYGGTGWTQMQRHIFQTEMAAAGAPPLLAFNIKMIGPVLYKYGSEEQKRRFLPGTLSLDIWWCQGYSEPGAGSDLAALQTRAVRDGDEYIVNGQKTWTTLAQYADWMFCLVRTDPDAARPQQGISFLLIDMNSPGIEVRPITTLDGSAPVNDVFLTDVRVPVANRIGEENQGWTCAKALLGNERTGIAQVAASKHELARLKRVASGISVPGGETLMQQDDFARRVAEVEVDLLGLEYSELRVLAAGADNPGPASSYLKIVGSGITQRLTELFVEAAGYHALPLAADAGDNIYPSWLDFAGRSAPKYFDTRKVSIFGGSNEIQRNIIAKAVLGL
ncbi:MAG: acyl-CoA dehydrogenase family protein [Gammaproteobacteria bacterium AqS3]|nr:acyl-CoA dehydrogenase family protein [Gammaproteobacteria bacterium AqS3]